MSRERRFPLGTCIRTEYRRKPLRSVGGKERSVRHACSEASATTATSGVVAAAGSAGNSERDSDGEVGRKSSVQKIAGASKRLLSGLTAAGFDLEPNYTAEKRAMNGNKNNVKTYIARSVYSRSAYDQLGY
eukprot:scpid89423/ scgid31316/ 